ncbi:peptidoglycan bridge formation glycyltransferase FemA/FemB family protein [Candidatus Microgenomates bacterium]|nr:peptidoglycan bridge formation glycyltransferase FemA/FemB family protein [Candidatus Microgenomates bacterium]
MTHILQSREWGEFRAKTPTVKKVLQVGGCQIFIHRVPHSPWTVAYLPRPEKIANLEKIKEACRAERAIFLKVEPLARAVPGNPSEPVLPQHTIYIDLTAPEEKLLAAMHEKTRYNIGLATKKGVKITEGENLTEFVKLLEKTEERQGFYSHPADYYETLWETLRPAKMVYLLSAVSGQQTAASIMLLRYKDFLYYAYGGSDPEYREMMAPHLLHWEAMRLGKKLDCKVYDLWGSYKNSPDEKDSWWGIYRFKKGFGGREVTFPQTVDIPLSSLYSLYPLAERFRRFLR